MPLLLITAPISEYLGAVIAGLAQTVKCACANGWAVRACVRACFRTPACAPNWKMRPPVGVFNVKVFAILDKCVAINRLMHEKDALILHATGTLRISGEP